MQIVRATPSEIDFKPFHETLLDWFSNREAAGLPLIDGPLRREDKLAGYRVIGAIEHDPLFVRYREAGINIEALYGKGIAGKTPDEVLNDYFRWQTYEAHRLVIRERLPAYRCRSFSSAHGRLGYHVLYLPYGAEQVTEIVIYVIPTDTHVRARKDWERVLADTPWMQDDPFIGPPESVGDSGGSGEKNQDRGPRPDAGSAARRKKPR